MTWNASSLLSPEQRLLVDLMKEVRELSVKVDKLIEQGVMTMSEIEDLVAQVNETKGIEQAAAVALQGLRAKIDELVANATELNQLKSQLRGLTSDLDQSEGELSSAIANEGGETDPPA